MREQGSNNVILTSAHREDLRHSSQDTIRKPFLVYSFLSLCVCLPFVGKMSKASAAEKNVAAEKKTFFPQKRLLKNMSVILSHIHWPTCNCLCTTMCSGLVDDWCTCFLLCNFFSWFDIKATVSHSHSSHMDCLVLHWLACVHVLFLVHQ